MPQMKPDAFPLPVVTDKAEGVLGQRQWRSLADFEGDPALAEAKQDEFRKDHGIFSPVDRRGFLQLLSGAGALATAAACWRPPEEHIYAYTRAPQNVPGVTQTYASAVSVMGHGVGIVAESYDGRPIKVDGNPQHPAARGRSSAFEQAALYGLYDPHRAKTLTRNGKPLAWRNHLVDLRELLEGHRKDGGQRLRFLVEPSPSPAVAQLRAQVRRDFPNARFYAYQPVGSRNQAEGARLAFGQPLEASYSLREADVIVSLDSDFLAFDPERLRLNKEFADRRVPENGMNRLYAIEPSLSVTGINADHRLRVKGGDVLAIARALASALGGEAAQFGGPAPEGKAATFIREVAKDLSQKRGRSLIVAGLRQPPAVHALCFALNQALGNLGRTVTFRQAAHDLLDEGPEALARLTAEIEGGRVDTLVVDAWNPVYSAPADVAFGEALRSKKVKDVLYLGVHRDETAQAATWFLPRAHDLESWGDLRSADGTTSLIQPLTRPLFGGIAPVSFWAAFVGRGEQKPYDLVKGYWKSRSPDGATFEATWQKWLADGVIPGTRTQPQEARVNVGGVAQAVRAAPAPAEGELELAIVPSYTLYDGSFSNNPWLKELPDPVTKVTWDNAALVSPATAKALGVTQGDLVKLSASGRFVEAPVYVLPGHADQVVTVALGYGRASADEEVANLHGFNAYTLRDAKNPWFVSGLKVEKLGRRYDLALTQEHGTLEGRDIALVADLSESKALGEAVARNRCANLPQDTVMQAPVDYSTGYKWGMAVDMSRCTACNACVVACQAENNIPVVGKDQVNRGREMHWLIIDRYFTGSDVDDPVVVPQPRFCVHCETAPCEYVCPVNATVHSDEGLNDMVYNRCVGTRYCSNNCPYKVRRFNYFHFSGQKSLPEKMMMNPDVTVRQRGVMEKCTYCVQRIERARIRTRIEGRPIREGDIVTACQQACPTDALTFGDLNDPNSRVAKLHQDDRRYDLLALLGTRPRTVHLARLTNKNPALVSHAAPQEEHH